MQSKMKMGKLFNVSFTNLKTNRAKDLIPCHFWIQRPVRFLVPAVPGGGNLRKNRCWVCACLRLWFFTSLNISLRITKTTKNKRLNFAEKVTLRETKSLKRWSWERLFHKNFFNKIFLLYLLFAIFWLNIVK